MTKIFMVLINGCRWNSFSFWGYHQVAGAYPGETDIFEHTLESCQEELTMA